MHLPASGGCLSSERIDLTDCEPGEGTKDEVEKPSPNTNHDTLSVPQAVPHNLPRI